MKLRQKLAMILAATSLATIVPVTTQAINYEVTKESLTTQNKDNYNKYWYVKLEDYQAANNALNVILFNNNNTYQSYIQASTDNPLAFDINATDIRFESNFYTETIGNEPFHDDNSIDVTNFQTMDANGDGTSVEEYTAYALEDKSQSHDGTPGFVGYPISGADSELPHRIFAIDEDGKYTSYVSSSYAVKKGYIYNNTNLSADYLTNKASDAGKEIYLFAEAKDHTASRSIFHKPLESIYVNVMPDGDKNLEVNTSDVIKSTNITDAGITANDNTDNNNNSGSTNPLNVYKFDDIAKNPYNAQIYLKEFTIELYDRDQLYVEVYQNFTKGARIYIPMAFSVTGAAPSVILDGGDINSNKLTLSTSNTAIKNLFDVGAKTLGRISVEGNGNIGTIEIEEQQEYVFYGKAHATGSWSSDLKDIASDLDDNGDSGVTLLLSLSDKALAFELSEGDRYWDEMNPHDPDSNDPGKLQEYITLSGGLRLKAGYVQIEVLAVDGNEMLLRIIDTTQEYSPRNYEGAIQLANLPVGVASRHDTLDTGDIEITITQVEDLAYESKGGDLGDFDFDNAREIDETFEIARVVDEQVLIGVDDELELVSGQEPDKITFLMSELLPGAIDTRDEFFFTFNNCNITSEWLIDMEFEFGRDSLDNCPDPDVDPEIFYKDGSEYVLDFDAMYDAAIDEGLINQDDSTSDKEEAWHELLEDLEFDIELIGKAGADGDISVAIESDNLSDGEILLYLGKTHPAFTYEVEPVYIDLGLRGQKGGRIVISETGEEMFRDGSEILIAIEDLGLENNTFDEVDVYADPDSGLDVKDTFKDGVLIIEIDDESDDGPGSIIIEDISFDIWAGTPRGGYDLYLGGSALSADNLVYDALLEEEGTGEDAYFEFISKQSDIRVQDFVTIGEGGAPVASSQIVMDLRSGLTYKDNSQVSMPSRPYQTPDGWVMVSAIDLALLYNIPMERITASTNDEGKMTVTIFKGTMGMPGSTVTTLTEGSNIVWVNATPVIMGTPVVLGADNKLYIHFLPISQALGLSAQWDNYSQRLTFSN